MALPYRRTISLPVGDSITLRWAQPRDQETRVLIDPAAYDTIRFAIAPEGSDEPALVKLLGQGVSVDAEKRISADVTGADTENLGPGRFLVQIRLERDGITRHTLRPLHVLTIEPSPS